MIELFVLVLLVNVLHEMRLLGRKHVYIIDLYIHVFIVGPKDEFSISSGKLSHPRLQDRRSPDADALKKAGYGREGKDGSMGVPPQITPKSLNGHCINIVFIFIDV